MGSGGTHWGWGGVGVSLHSQEITAEERQSIFVLPSFVSREVWVLCGVLKSEITEKRRE